MLCNAVPNPLSYLKELTIPVKKPYVPHLSVDSADLPFEHTCRNILNSLLYYQKLGVLPVVHGSTLGVQGGSQVLVIKTVGLVEAQARPEGITGQNSKQLMVQLNDPVSAAAAESPDLAVGVQKLVGTCPDHTADCCKLLMACSP